MTKTNVIRTGMLIGAVVFCVAGCAALRYLNYKSSPNPPPKQGEMELEGLTAPVRITFDAHAVPHIMAQNDEDLAFALGYVHARERLFQMELMKRTAYGRLSEWFGRGEGENGVIFKDLPTTDRFLRTIGLWRDGEKGLAEADDFSRRITAAYSNGVNRFIAQGEWPIEYRLMDVAPEPWDAKGVMAVARLTGWGISANVVSELIRLMIRLEIGPEAVQEIFPAFDYPGPAIIEREEVDYREKVKDLPADCEWKTPRHPSASLANAWPSSSGSRELADQALRVSEGLALVRGIIHAVSPGNSSNNWVLSGAHTQSGKPLLANDPHLGHTAPGIFYLVRLTAPGIDAVGASLPGTPTITLGHTSDLAWAATTTFTDVQDIYIEKVDPNNPSAYLTPEGSVPFVEEKHVIRVKKGSGFVEEPFVVRLTRHGPILTDAVPHAFPPGAPLLAMKTTMEGETRDLITMWGLLRAKNLADFKEAFSHWTIPIQSWLVATSEGDIGLYPVGKIPIRCGWDGAEPVPGWTGEFEWRGYLPFEQVPQLFNPKSGLIVTANNKLLPFGDYPVSTTFDPMRGYRAERINKLLKGQDKWTPEEIQKVQLDSYVVQADYLKPIMLGAISETALDEREKKALALLKDWDNDARVESVGATLFYSTYRMAWELALKEAFSPALYDLVTSTVIVHGFFDHLLMTHPQSRVFDLKSTPEKESRDDLLRLSFKKAVANLEKDLGGDMTQWRWGRLHQLTYSHPFGRDASVASTFNVGPFEMPGGPETVWAADVTYGPKMTFPVSDGPVFRQVYDFGAPQKGGVILNLGQSGWPATPEYMNAQADWSQGKLWSIPLGVQPESSDSGSTLRLTPLKK